MRAPLQPPKQSASSQIPLPLQKAKLKPPSLTIPFPKSSSISTVKEHQEIPPTNSTMNRDQKIQDFREKFKKLRIYFDGVDQSFQSKLKLQISQLGGVISDLM
jgi:hypothetical protein